MPDSHARRDYTGGTYVPPAPMEFRERDLLHRAAHGREQNHNGETSLYSQESAAISCQNMGINRHAPGDYWFQLNKTPGFDAGRLEIIAEAEGRGRARSKTMSAPKCERGRTPDTASNT